MKFFGLDLPDPRRERARFIAKRTSKFIPHQSTREKARRLKQLADQQARILAKLESRG